MADNISYIAEYLKKSGQTLQQLYSGADQYGVGFIHARVKEAIKNNQRIVWYPDPANKKLGLLLYRFEDI